LDKIFIGFSHFFYNIEISKFDIPEVRYYTEESEWIKPKSIPMFNDQIDFRFLPGDLGNEQGLSKPLDDILKDIEKNNKKSKQNYYFLLGVSGCGKTKTIFDVAKIYYTLIFDFTPELMEDVTKTMELIENLVYLNVDPEFDCRLVVRRLYLSRLLILVYFLKKNIIKSPEQWLCWQYSAKISEFTNPLIEQLSQYDLIEMDQIQDHIKKWIRLDLQKKIVIAMDEANILVELHQNKFHDSKGISFLRPLSTLMIRSFSRLQFPFIISGTHMKIMDKDSISSAVLKDYFDNYIQINGFRCNNSDDALKLINRFMKLDQNQNRIFEKNIELFLGRSRIISNFLIHLMNSNEEDLEIIISNWKKESIESTKYKSFYSLINRFVISNPNQWEKFLADLIYTFYLKKGIVRVNTLETDYMAAGFCFFHGINGSDYEFKLSEVILNSTYLDHCHFIDSQLF
jgi:DNA-directed RNA polymerase subunit F